MLNQGAGRGDTRYYAMVLAMTDYMDPGSAERREYRDRALERLVTATESEALARGKCRDTSLAAALRLRPW